MDAKICGVKDPKTLEYIINHNYPPKFIGFIANYPKSKRYLEFNQLKKILNVDKKNINFVCVLVDPDDEILEKISKLSFDYLQLYKVSPERTKKIKEIFNIKIITALTIEDINDVLIYKQYEKISDIILFDSKGYEKSMSFDHNLLDEVEDHIEKMIAGNIKIEHVTNFKNKNYILDISGSLESSKGVKDINKIDKFLNTVHNINS